MADNNDEQYNDAQQGQGVARAMRSIKRGGETIFDGADGSIFWLIKWSAAQLKLAAEAISQQFMAAQNGAQRRIEERRQDGDQ